MANNEATPEIYDFAMSEVKKEISRLNEGIDGINRRLDTLNGNVRRHEDLLWGDGDEPESQRAPGVVETVRYLKDLADKSLVVLRVARWVFGFIGASLFIFFLQNIFTAIYTLTQGQPPPAMP